MFDYIVVPASERDLESLNHLMYALHDEHHLACPEYFKTAAEIEQEKSIATYLDDPQGLVYVARYDGQIIGFITGHFCELISTVSKTLLMGSIDELYVCPSYRKRGVADALCCRIENTFRDYGVRQVFVEVWNFNQSALNFYAESGFSHHIHYLIKPIKQAHP